MVELQRSLAEEGEGDDSDQAGGGSQ
jgi:hypothetical protein